MRIAALLLAVIGLCGLTATPLIASELGEVVSDTEINGVLGANAGRDLNLSFGNLQVENQ